VGITSPMSESASLPEEEAVMEPSVSVGETGESLLGGPMAKQQAMNSLLRLRASVLMDDTVNERSG